MRISDWSSDVCSSDLAGLGRAVVRDMARMHRWDWTKGDLPSFDRPSPGTEAVEWNLNHWARVWEEDCNEDVPFVTELAHWLKRNMPAIDRISLDRKSTRLNSSHYCASRMPYSA